MVRRVKVTRHGMTNCPQCHAHIRVAAELSSTVCPFCETHLKDVVPASDLGRLSGLSRVARASRSGVVAASILGLSGLAGCETSSSVPVYGGAPADVMVPDTVEDAVSAPEYGLPADIMVADTVEDATSQPEYGLPADVTENAKEDVPPAPPYGIPPDAE